MSNELTISKTGTAPSTAFKGVDLPKSKLGSGIEGGMPWCRIAYKGKDWSIRDGSTDKPIKTRDLNLVVLKAANHPSRRFFKEGWKEGQPPRSPDCYSTGGFKPDAGAPVKQDDGKGCLLCPQNAWASKEGSRGKACHEYKMLAVVPAGDIENKSLRGPMQFAVPPNSLKALKLYDAKLDGVGVHYSQVVTNVSFAPGLFEFAFDATVFLDDVQAAQAIKMMNHPMVDRILDEEISVGAGDTDSATPSYVGAAQKLEDISEPAPAQTPEDKPVQPQPAPAKPAPAAPPPEETPKLTPAEQEIADLKTKLAAAEAAAKPKRGRPRHNGARTPQVAPTNMDSEALKGPPLPEPVGQTVAGTPANDLQAAGKDPALEAINATLSRAKGLI